MRVMLALRLRLRLRWLGLGLGLGLRLRLRLRLRRRRVQRRRVVRLLLWWRVAPFERGSLPLGADREGCRDCLLQA